VAELAAGADDPRLAPLRMRERQLTTIADRRADAAAGRFVAEGDLVVERAVAAGCSPEVLLCSESEAARLEPLVAGSGCTVLVADEDVRREATGLGVALGAIGAFRRPAPRTAPEVLATARRIVVLDRVDNPGNVGAIVRTAVALGWDALLLERTSADPLARRALRTSMGAALSLPWARTDDLAGTVAGLVRDGVDVVALDPDGPANASSLPAAARLAVVLGAEREGVAPEVAAACSTVARIPMAAGTDSLNVAAAAAVACWLLR
jgi:tRNA G18 (ribose-2'-O)-methylase SpoU